MSLGETITFLSIFRKQAKHDFLFIGQHLLGLLLSSHSPSKCFTVGWKFSNLLFGLKAAILKLSQKLQGLSRRLHVLLNKNTRSVKMENLINLRCLKQKYSFSQRVFENWSYFTFSIIIQASYKHQLLKITVRIPTGLPKILGRTRRAFDWQKKLQQAMFHYVWENVCIVQV